MNLAAVIFDLDGVITDTAELHFQAWKRLADEHGLPFDRQVNERLRGVSRRDSWNIILAGQPVPESELQASMARKNAYYQEMLVQITPADLLPGVAALLDELAAAGIPAAIASASRNAPEVVARLGIGDRLAAVVDGSVVARAKPAPDLFRYAAAALDRPPGRCLVVEDAAAGVEAALAAGMPVLALGPAERFAALPEAAGVPRRESLAGTHLADLEAAAAPDPRWTVVQDAFRPEEQNWLESVFTVGNGYFASRGAFEEGYPGEMRATLAHGVFDDIPIGATELANLPDWLDLSIRVDGERFRLDEGELLHFRRVLDLRRALLRREVRWRSPGGVEVDVTMERFASYDDPHLGALRLLITPVGRPCRVDVETGVDGHQPTPDLSFKTEVVHWRLLDQGEAAGPALWLTARTRHSGIEIGAAATVQAAGAAVDARQCPGQPRFAIEAELPARQTLQVEKVVSYTASRDQAAGAADVADRAAAALQGVSYDAVKAAHIGAWARLWRESDVNVEGDDAAQQALRFSLYHLLIAAPQVDERASIGAKTLSGYGYRGHAFWDTETFMLPFFTYTQPHLARNMLLYRYHTLPGARRKAAGNGFSGAQFAWESAVTGDEVTPTWVPNFAGGGLVRIWCGDIELHITADVAYAFYQYWRVTGDDDFMAAYGAELILDTARFWAERAEREETNGDHRYALRDVIGPDEYHEHVDNNAFTNRMVQWHLQTALEVYAWLEAHHPARAAALTAALDLTAGRLAHWQDIIDRLVVIQEPDSGLIHQFEGFFERKPVDPEVIASAPKSMQVILGIHGANQSQVIKQADVIMLLCLLRDAYTDPRVWQANWDAYMPRTDLRYGSSLGPSVHAWAACELGLPEEAYDHFMLAARADLEDVRGNAKDGIHGASAGGLWQAAVFGFAGLRLDENGYSFRPCLPSHWTRLAFRFNYRGRPVSVDIDNMGGEVEIKTREEPIMTVRDERESSGA